MDLLSDPFFVAASLAGVCLLGLSKGGFFGLGVMALPLMALSVPPMQAAAILLPTVLAQDALTVWVYRRDWSAWNLKVMIPSMAVGIAGATLVAAALSPTHIRLAIGLIAAAFVLRHWLGQRFDRLAARADEPGSGRVSGARTSQWPRWPLASLASAARADEPGSGRVSGARTAQGPRWPLASLASAAHANTLTGIAFGALGGVTTLLANAGGPAWQMHLLPQRLDKLTYLGTLTMLFAASNVMKIPAFGAIGQLTVENLAVGAALLPAAVAANYAGIWLVRRTPAELFFRIVYILMFLIAVELMRGSLTELWRG